jgi:hypothetical protein
VALKDFLTFPAELRPFLLKALLYGRVITQLLSAKARRISGTCLLLFQSAHMLSALSKTIRGGKYKRDYQKHASHSVILFLPLAWPPMRQFGTGAHVPLG